MELNIIAPNVAGGETLFQTRSAAGNLGDLIIAGTEAGRFKNMVKAGLLMDLTDLLKGKDVLAQVYTEFGMRALPGNDIPVPEEWGGEAVGSWKDGAPALNFKPLSPVDIDPRTNEPYLTVMWSSVLEKNNTKLDLDWQNYAGGAKTCMEFLKSIDALLVAPGTSYIASEESSDITILRNKCKSVIIDHSWKMVFADTQAEFDRLLKDLRETVNGLGYQQVLAVDMQNARQEAASRIQAVEDFNNNAKNE